MTLFFCLINSAIHKAAGLTVPGLSMILPGTIPETSISREWSRWLERSPDYVLYSGRPYGGFVNSAVISFTKISLILIEMPKKVLLHEEDGNRMKERPFS